jgi:uncharacterized protein (DUF488 family)
MEAPKVPKGGWKQTSMFKYTPKQSSDKSNSKSKTPNTSATETKDSNTDSKEVTLYTIGYGGHSYDELISILKANSIKVLADIRISPNGAYIEHFKRPYLEQHLPLDHGIKYIWLQNLGNPYHSTEMSLEKFSKYLLDKNAADNRLKSLLDLCTANDSKVAIMCGCKYVDSCHRSIVAQHFLTQCKSLHISCKVINL